MTPIAIAFGTVLTLFGIGLYATTAPEHKSWTALIPSIFGLVLVLLGQIARGGSEKTRMHTMHAAVLVGLIGLVVPAYRAIAALANGAEFGRAIAGQLIMAAICAIFLVFCIKSFIDARKARKQRPAGSEPPA